MKNIILLITLLILSVAGYSQTYDKPGNYGIQWKRGKFDSSFKVPIFTDTLRKSVLAGNGDIIYVQSPTGTPDTGFWGIENGAYTKLGASASTPTDTTSLSNRINAKEPTITAGTTSDVWQGDKTWVTKIGLPVTTATQTKLNDSFAKKLEYVSVIPQADTSNAWMVACIIRPTMDTTTGQNTWSLINDSDHKPLNIDSISVTTSYVRVDYTHKCHRIGSFVASPDESTVAMQFATYKSTWPQYGEGGYKVGVRSFRDYCEIYISKPARLAFYLQRDSTNAVWTQGALAPVTMGLVSTPFTINNSTSYFDIRGESVVNAKGAPSIHVQLGNGETRFILEARYEVISPTWHRVWITNAANTIINVATYPHNMRLLIDYGEADVLINPLTENFPAPANFWCMGIFFGQRI